MVCVASIQDKFSTSLFESRNYLNHIRTPYKVNDTKKSMLGVLHPQSRMPKHHSQVHFRCRLLQYTDQNFLVPQFWSLGGELKNPAKIFVSSFFWNFSSATQKQGGGPQSPNIIFENTLFPHSCREKFNFSLLGASEVLIGWRLLPSVQNIAQIN